MKMYSKVRIKSTGVTGIIVDIVKFEGKVFYTVEDDKTDSDGGLILHDCKPEEVEPL